MTRGGQGLLPGRREEAAAGLDEGEQRTQRLLAVGCALLALICLQALLRHGLTGQSQGALLQLPGLALALGCWVLGRRGSAARASLLFVAGAALLIAAHTLAIDVPDADTPRTLPLYLLPLLLFSEALLAPQRRALRWTAQGGLLLLFLVLIGLPPTPGLLTLSAAQRSSGALFTVVSVLLLLALLTHLHDGNWLARGQTELALGRAIASGRLSLALQPQCDASGRLLGAEALVRWHDAQRGWVSPAQFVPLAERCGLIQALGEQVLVQVLRLLRDWQHQPALAGLPVAVNLSALQLQDDGHLQQLLDRVRAAGLPRGLLKFELTETVLVVEPDRLRTLLQRCQDEGIATALDDFGTGFASLALLSQLPFEQLKIDQRFVRQLPGNLRGQKVAGTLVELGQRLGMAVIAEGVETAEHVELLRAMGVEQFQGYHFGRPMAPADFEAWCRAAPR